jgi:hypothetical protein
MAADAIPALLRRYHLPARSVHLVISKFGAAKFSHIVFPLLLTPSYQDTAAK